MTDVIRLKLPHAIRNGHDYRRVLGCSLGLYEPLEHALAGFADWDAFGLVTPSRRQAPSLTQGLLALGIDPAGLLRAPAAVLPDLPGFPQALGAFYVLEGATLGGRVIFRDLQARLGAEIAGVTEFFGGRGAALGPMRQQARAGLDRLGEQHADQSGDVVAGARRTFQATLTLFAACAAPPAAAP